MSRASPGAPRAVLIAGCGYVGSALAASLVSDGDIVYGLRRGASPLPDGVVPIQADLFDPSTLRSLPGDVDHVVYAVSARERSEAAYRDAYVRGLENLLEALAGHALRRAVFVSSTAVYGQDDGSWVDERSPTEPSSFSGQILLEGERTLGSASFETTSLRLAGIYGPSRTWLIRQVHEGTARLDPEGGPFRNRIHRDDCAGALRHLLRMPTSPGRVVIGVDNDPAPIADVYRFLADELGLEPPPEGEAGPARGGNKRCSNALLTSAGYELRVPSYREGYPPIVAEYRASLTPAAG